MRERMAGTSGECLRALGASAGEITFIGGGNGVQTT
jgi:hypothetical protein